MLGSHEGTTPDRKDTTAVDVAISQLPVDPLSFQPCMNGDGIPRPVAKQIFQFTSI